MADAEAPGNLEVLRDFVNTWDEEEGIEELGSPAELTAWLRERALLGAGSDARPADLRRALELREALREVLLAHNGARGPVADPAAVLDATARRARMRLAFGAGAGSWLVAEAPGVDGALGRLLGIVHAAEADGTWARLKACGQETCRWAFYDRTKNHSRRWCSMADCGNRAKARAYRERHAGET
jgi:predicted RNA-binding Zn ribbon-like protein